MLSFGKWLLTYRCCPCCVSGKVILFIHLPLHRESFQCCFMIDIEFWLAWKGTLHSIFRQVIADLWMLRFPGGSDLLFTCCYAQNAFIVSLKCSIGFEFRLAEKGTPHLILRQVIADFSLLCFAGMLAALYLLPFPSKSLKCFFQI